MASGTQNTDPFVSVLVPTYNRRGLLEKTLDTLLTQTYPNYELLVCDNCSTDDTYDFLLARQKTCSRLKVFRNDRNLNFHGNLFRLFSMASGEFIGMQHDHDLYKPEFLARMVGLLQRFPSAGFGCAAYDLLDTNDQLKLAPPLPECDIFGDGLLPGAEFIKVLANEKYTPVAAMSTIFRKSVVEKAGGYRTDWYLASDEDLYRRVASISDVAYCPEQLFVMRLRPEKSQKELGGWKNIYTLFLYRMSVADLLADRGKRSRARWRQFWFKWKAVLHDGLYFWLRGDAEELRRATDLNSVLTLPTTRSALNRFESIMLKAYMEVLRAGIRLGPRLNKLRARQRVRV